jgi:NDP-sugar pyrophosphorylase family protein
LLTRDLIGMFRSYFDAGGACYLADTAWTLQVDTDRDLLALNHYLLDENLDAHILSELPASVQVTPPVRIDPQVSVGQGAHIGPYVYLESGCSIGTRAKVVNSIVMQNAAVRPDESVTDTILATRARIHG